METAREHKTKRIDKDTLERKKWQIVLNTIPQIAKMTDSPEFIKGLKVGLYFSLNSDSSWATGNGSEFAQETRERLGLNLHQYNICCQAIFQHKYNDDYHDLHLQKKTRNEIIDDLSKKFSTELYPFHIQAILDYYEKYK